jgi:hypothetical protein
MIDFPSSPTVGQIFSQGVLSWQWDGTKWAASSSTNNPRYIVACFVPGLMVPSQTLLEFRISKPVTFPVNFGLYLGHTSEARGSAPSTAITSILIQRATQVAPSTFTGVGSIVFGPGEMLGTLTTSGGLPVNFAQGDTLAITGAATPDATFKDFAATLVGFET